MVRYISALHRTLPVFPQPMGPRPWKINKGTPQLVSTLSTQLQLLNIYFIRNKSRQTHKAETLFSRAWQLITKTRHKRENLRTTFSQSYHSNSPKGPFSPTKSISLSVLFHLHPFIYKHNPEKHLLFTCTYSLLLQRLKYHHSLAI